MTVCWTGKWLHDKGSYRVCSGDLDEFVELGMGDGGWGLRLCMMGKSGDNEAFGGDDGFGSGWIGAWFSEEKGEGGSSTDRIVGRLEGDVSG